MNEEHLSERVFREVLAGRVEMTAAQKEEALVAAVRQLQAALNSLRQGKLELAAVVAALPPKPSAASAIAQAGSLVVHVGSALHKVEYPAWMTPPPERGDLARCTDSGQVLSIDPAPPYYGAVFTVTRALEPGAYEVDGERVVFASKKYVKAALRIGTQVLLDSSCSVVVRDLGAPPSAMTFAEETGVSWDDIGGQDEAKKQMKDVIEGPVRHGDVYRRFGMPTPKGVLLFGTPGNGKTMFGKAAATAVRDLYGRAGRTGFLYVKGPEILDKYVGESEGAVRGIFEHAAAHYEASGTPCVVYIDEADAIVGRRGARVNLGMEVTIVPQFLAEMDGLDASRALLILSTNRPDSLDPAIVRDGRIDVKIHVKRPGKAEAADILAKALRPRITIEPAAELADSAVEEIFASRHGVAMIRVRRGSDRRVQLSDFLSGAMCVGIVNRATKFAIDRFLAETPPEGILRDDIAAAVRATAPTLRHLDQTAELADLIEELGGEENVRKVEPI